MDRHVHPIRRGTHRLTCARNGNVPEIRLHLLGERWKSIPMGVDITIYSEQRVGAIPGCALTVVSRTVARHGKG
ncbi:MAG: hypothetical protein OXJ37_23280 [Bryobacterales bacterium]|nr:hypothetical protein [Bryobacterales bacterium]